MPALLLSEGLDPMHLAPPALPAVLRAGRARSLPSPPIPPPSVRDRWVAAAILFALDGALFGSWAARIPDVARQVGAGSAALGLALLCVSLGSLGGMQVAGRLCERFGAGRVAAASAALAALTLVPPGRVASVAALGGALLAFGAATGTLNVSANALGVRVEHAAGRPVVPSLHGAFSLGGLAGAGVAALTAPAVGVGLHLLAVGAAGVAVAAAVGPVLARSDGPASTGSPAARRRPVPRVVLVLGAIAGCAAFGEGAVSDWGGIYLREQLAVSPGVAAAAYACFSLAMATGRLAGGALLRRLDTTALLVGGGLLATVGALAVAGSAGVASALVGFVLIGLGLANVFPVAIGRAGALGGAGGVARASTVGYTGLLGGPPLLGFLAGVAGIGSGFLAVAVLALTAVALAVVVAPARPAPGVVLARARSARDAGAGAAATWLARYADGLQAPDHRADHRADSATDSGRSPNGLAALLS